MGYYIEDIFLYIEHYTAYKRAGQELNEIFEKYLSML